VVISVLIVNWNGMAYLERCLASAESAAAEVSGALEIVVADNGSTDGSLEMLRRHSGVRLVEMPENLGFGCANNRAAAVAQGEALLLLNSDAWLLPGSTARLLAALEADPRVGLAAPLVRSPDGRPEAGWVPQTSILGELIQRLRNVLPRRLGYGAKLEGVLRAAMAGWFTGACMMVRRRAFDEVGGFDPEFFLYFEDADLCARLSRQGWRLVRAPRATVVHVGGGSRAPSRVITSGVPRELDRRVLAYRRSQILYYRKHRPRWEQALLRRHLRGKLRDPALRAELGLETPLE
jgi:hypothetical protein